MEGRDAVIAQLMGMGFQPEDIEQYQKATAASSEGFSLQAATEWLLQRSQRRTNPTSDDPPTLTLSPSSLPPSSLPPSSQPDIQKPMSSGSVLSSHSQPLRSRYDLGAEHARDKERYAAKEREEVIRRSRERKLDETKARNLIKQQIADDRRARQSRGKPVLSPPASSSSSSPGVEGGGGGGGEGRREEEKTATAEAKDQPSSKNPTCRLQIRLPNGKVLRHSLPAAAPLSEVAQFVTSSYPRLSSPSLVQPFPHHQFTSEEMTQSLLSLGLCPSASLVVPRQTSQSSSPATQPGSVTSQTGSPSGQTSSPSAQTGPASGHSGRVTSGGAEKVNDEMPTGGEGVIKERPDDVEMEEESHSDGEEMEVEPDEQDAIPPPLPPVPRLARPNFGPPLFGPPAPLRQLPRAPPGQFPGLPPLGGRDVFGGEGHKLGGKETVVIGDAQLLREEAGRVAARKRVLVHTTLPTDKVAHHLPAVPSLLSLCTRTLVGLTSNYGLPSCSSLPPGPAHILLDVLRSHGRLNTKTMAAFHGCPLQSMVLDNYSYATNELVGSLWHFSSLERLSLSGCTIITDKAIAALFPYLSRLTEMNLEGCRQLTDAIFRPIRCCVSMESLNLSHVKATDRGIRLLLHSPLSSLTNLNLSHTRITSSTLTALPQGTPALEELSIESTEVKELSALCRLPRLHTLNIAHCDCGSEVGSLSGCGQLSSLNMSGVSLPSEVFQLLSGLPLTCLTLPDRGTLFDVSMETISKFPLISLNLMDYCYVSDVGVANIVSMTTLMELTLSRTKLTDAGMLSVAALSSLRHLNIDNTQVTDVGLLLIKDLVRLESLSLSDTRVTSGFILHGALDRMGQLSKLNLSRTAVCDKGLLRLSLPSLVMINLDWTGVSDAITLTSIRDNGCPFITTLRNSNIGQPLRGQQQQQRHHQN